MSLRTWPKGESHFKQSEPPSAILRHQKRKATEQALQAAYEEVDKRDGNQCRVTGVKLHQHAVDPKHRREHHHLKGRNVRPEWVTDPNRIVLVSRLAHGLITAGWIVVEGEDARKAVRFFWADHVRPEQRIFRIRSRRRSQNREE